MNNKADKALEEFKNGFQDWRKQLLREKKQKCIYTEKVFDKIQYGFMKKQSIN